MEKKQKQNIKISYIKNPETPILIAIDGTEFYTLCRKCVRSTNVRSAMQCRIFRGHKAPDGRSSTVRGRGRQFPNHLVGHDAPYAEATDGVIEDADNPLITLEDMLGAFPGMLDAFPGSGNQDKLSSFEKQFNFHLTQLENDACACSSPKPGGGRSMACGSTGKTQASASRYTKRRKFCSTASADHAHTQV